MPLSSRHFKHFERLLTCKKKWAQLQRDKRHWVENTFSIEYLNQYIKVKRRTLSPLSNVHAIEHFECMLLLEKWEHLPKDKYSQHCPMQIFSSEIWSIKTRLASPIILAIFKIREKMYTCGHLSIESRISHIASWKANKCANMVSKFLVNIPNCDTNVRVAPG